METNNPYSVQNEVHPNVQQKNVQLLEEIAGLLEEQKKYRKEKDKDLSRVEKLKQCNEKAHETISKAEKNLERLTKGNEYLKGALENANERTSKAMEYWKQYGFDVKELPNSQVDGKEFANYQFIFSKSVIDSKVGGNLTSSGKENSNGHYVIGVKVSAEKFLISSQQPTVFNQEQLDELDVKLTETCIDAGKVDYKLAMMNIKRSLIKSRSCPTKTC